MSGIQFQTVLFHNRPEALKRSARSLCASLEYARGHGQNLARCVLLWGDASEKSCMTEAELEKLRSECTGLDIHDISRDTNLTEITHVVLEEVGRNRVETSICRKLHRTHRSAEHTSKI